MIKTLGTTTVDLREVSPEKRMTHPLYSDVVARVALAEGVAVVHGAGQNAAAVAAMLANVATKWAEDASGFAVDGKHLQAAILYDASVWLMALSFHLLGDTLITAHNTAWHMPVGLRRRLSDGTTVAYGTLSNDKQ